MSILDTRFDTPYNTAPFSKIKTDDFLASFEKRLKVPRMKLIKLLKIRQLPTFENTIEALDYTGRTTRSNFEYFL